MKTTLSTLTAGFALLAYAAFAATTRTNFLILAWITVFGFSLCITALMMELRKLIESTQKATLLKAQSVQFVKIHALRMKRLRNLKR